MNYDPTAAYRQAQVTTVSPTAQVVLLYEGAIRFCAQHIQKLAQGDLEGAHNTSLRAQAIISALRESLDMSTGPIATQLDALYDYMHRRLVEGNLAKDDKAAREVIGLLRDLLEAWRAIASSPQGAPRPTSATAMQTSVAPPSSQAAGLPVAAYRSAYAGLARA